MLKTTLAFATDHFEVDPDTPSYGASELMELLLDVFAEQGHEALPEMVGESWGASCEFRVDGVRYDIMAVLIDAEARPAIWWVIVSPADTRPLLARLFRPRDVANPPHVVELVEHAVRTIPGVRDVEWYDPDRDLPPTLF